MKADERLPHVMAADDAVLVLVSRQDPASLNIRDALLEMHPWREDGELHGLPVRAHDDFLMAEVHALHLECDLVDRALREAGWCFGTVLVASKHKAESGRAALTVHPIGNPHAAQFGGLPGRLVPAAPVVMGRVLRRLHAEAAGLKHQVTFEATHHGPYLETPTAFVEIGTDAAAWTDRGLGRRVARALLDATREGAGDAAPVLVALGGSHYAPRATDLVKASRANFGHILPGYAFDPELPPGVLLDAVRGTPGCRGYFLDERQMPEPPQVVRNVLGPLDLGWWREEDL